MITYKPYWNALNSAERKFYEDVISGFQLRQTVIKTTFPSTEENIGHIVHFIFYDNPLIFYVDVCETKYSIDRSGVVTIYPKYLYDKVVAKQLEARCVREARKMVGTEKLTPYELELKIHNNLCEKVVYKDIGPDAHNILGIFIRGQSVCEGISKAAKLCFDLANIKSGVAISDDMIDSDTGHAWNLVNLNNSWYHLDITWDNGYADDTTNNEENFYNYFNVTDAEMSKSRGLKQIPSFIKCNSTRDNYFVRNGTVANSLTEFKRIALNEIRKKRSSVHIRCADHLLNNPSSLAQTFVDTCGSCGLKQCSYIAIKGVFVAMNLKY